MSFWNRHKAVEKHATLMMTLSLVVVSIGGIVEIAPLFYLENTIEKVEGMRPYTPLELAGRRHRQRRGAVSKHVADRPAIAHRREVERVGRGVLQDRADRITLDE